MLRANTFFSTLKMTTSRVEHLVVDTNAFINGADIRSIGENIYTIREVVDEVTCRKQLRHLSVLDYDLIVKDVFAENVKFVTEFSKKTGDYPSLSAVDIKVIALTYQLEKEKVGTSHLNSVPQVQQGAVIDTVPEGSKPHPGFFIPLDGKDQSDSTAAKDDENQLSDDDLDDLHMKLKNLEMTEEDPEENILIPVTNDSGIDDSESKDNQEEEYSSDESGEDDGEWITVNNVTQMKKSADDAFSSDDKCVVSCITADFAMQNLLKQIGLNVSSYDGKLIRKVRTFILRCIACFKTTSVMTKQFCPNCGHSTLKRVSVTLDENGQRHIFINTRRPLTSRGKRFSLPAPKGGQRAQNPILTADQARPHQKSTKLARTKNNPLDPDYIAGFSPFIMRDVNSKSAVMGVRNHTEIKNWMRKNPNEVRKKRK